MAHKTPGSRTSTGEKAPKHPAGGSRNAPPSYRHIRPTKLDGPGGTPPANHDGSSFRPADSSGNGPKTDTKPAARGEPVRGRSKT